MRVYTVHAPPEAADTPERFVFVKEGFSWPALFVPILWTLWHRMWLVTLLYLLWAVLLFALGWWVGEPQDTVIALLGGILFALEANNLRRWSLGRRGWTEVGAAAGKDLEEAEIRFFGGWLGEGRMRAESSGDDGLVDRREAMARAAYSPQARSHGADEPIFGLFPEPER